MSTIEKALAKQKQAEQAIDSIKDIAPTPAINSEAKPAIERVTAKKHKPIDFVLNGESLIARGYMFDAGSRKETQEEFRHIKRKLLNNAFGQASKTLKNSNLIMVSSSRPNEGKTFISINLALSIALEQDKTVLLVDADVLRPSLGRELEYGHQKGLLEYLLSEVESLSDIIYSTNIDKLKIIPAGEPHHLTNELLASDRMAKLANELAERYPDRIVIFDCPPILGITETPVLANLMGQAVIVVEESKTKIADVQNAASQLNENMAIGFVLNKTIKSTKDTYGYYGYGYGSKD